MRNFRNRKSAFTLVEILIVVIILGILAAIVIPQFTNASEDARNNSTTSQLQTLRSQIELFKLQHRDRYPTTDLGIASAWDWTKLTTKTDEDGAAGGNLGPYMQVVPTNPRNGLNTVTSVADDAAAAGVAANSGFGFIFSQATGKMFVTDKDGAYTAD
jgi:general secretion pathway protein G